MIDKPNARPLGFLAPRHYPLGALCAFAAPPPPKRAEARQTLPNTANAPHQPMSAKRTRVPFCLTLPLLFVSSVPSVVQSPRRRSDRRTMAHHQTAPAQNEATP